MTPLHIVVLVVTLLALLCLPCIVAVLISADDLDAAEWTHGRRRETRALRRLDRSLTKTDVVPIPAQRPGGVSGPSIEQLAADLRRLDRQRHGGVATESTVWLAAVLRAYDQRLRLASRCLGVAEHLEMLDGIDRDIERVRVESQLQAAGLVVCSSTHRPPDRFP